MNQLIIFTKIFSDFVTVWIQTNTLWICLPVTYHYPSLPNLNRGAQ